MITKKVSISTSELSSVFFLKKKKEKRTFTKAYNKCADFKNYINIKVYNTTNL